VSEGQVDEILPSGPPGWKSASGPPQFEIGLPRFKIGQIAIWGGTYTPSAVLVLSSLAQLHFFFHFQSINEIQVLELVSVVRVSAFCRPLCSGAKHIKPRCDGSLPHSLQITFVFGAVCSHYRRQRQQKVSI